MTLSRHIGRGNGQLGPEKQAERKEKYGRIVAKALDGMMSGHAWGETLDRGEQATFRRLRSTYTIVDYAYAVALCVQTLMCVRADKGLCEALSTEVWESYAEFVDQPYEPVYTHSRPAKENIWAHAHIANQMREIIGE